jgi:CRISPR system Cascade subunit CasB
MPASPEEFVADLEKLAAPPRPDLGALAKLRRGLGKPPWDVPDTFPFVVPRLPEEERPWRDRCYFLVASLFAWHPRSAEPENGVTPNFGASFAQLRNTDGSVSESVERRFSILLVSNEDELPDRLRSAVGLLRTRQVPVGWTQLLQDLINWNSQWRTVQRRWARSFWSQPPYPHPES